MLCFGDFPLTLLNKLQLLIQSLVRWWSWLTICPCFELLLSGKPSPSSLDCWQSCPLIVLEMFSCYCLLSQQKNKTVLVSSRFSSNGISAVVSQIPDLEVWPLAHLYCCRSWSVSHMWTYMTCIRVSLCKVTLLLIEYEPGEGNECVCVTVVPFVWYARNIYLSNVFSFLI